MRSKIRSVGLLSLFFASACRDSDHNVLTVPISLPEQHIQLATKATITVDYARADARLISQNGEPACAFIIPGVDGEFFDDGQGTITIHASGPRATRGPANIAACRMRARDESATAADVASRISVRIESANDDAGKSIDPSIFRTSRRNSQNGADDVDIEQAQARAVAAAAAMTNGSRRLTGATPAHSLGIRDLMISEADATAAWKASTLPIASSHSTAAGSTGRTGQATSRGGPAQEIIDDSAIRGDYRDSGYDDSPADDETVPSYSLDLFVQSSGLFGALQLDITHLGSSGGFIGRGGKVDCVSLVEGALVASNYIGERLTKVGLIKLEGVSTPAAVMRCGFRTRETVSPSSFVIDVTDASDTESNKVEPTPAVVISGITPRR